MTTSITNEEEKKVIETQETSETPESHQESLPTPEDIIKELEDKILNLETITKKAQHDYIMLKYDFDSLVTRTEKEKEENKLNAMIDNIKKFLPFIEQLRQSLTTLTDEQADSSLAKGITLVYGNLLKTLEKMNITPIQSQGLEPDAELHEPLGSEPVTDETLKGKIIKEYEQGFVYIKDDKKIIIKASKVIIGQ